MNVPMPKLQGDFQLANATNALMAVTAMGDSSFNQVTETGA